MSLYRKTLAGAGLGVALLCAAPAVAQVPETPVGRDARTAATLTIYQQDLTLIDERRRVDLGVGRNRLAIQDVGTALRPETVTLSGTDLRVIERVFAFDLLTPQRLLEAAVGQKVRVVRTNPQTGAETVLEAELLAIADGPVLRIGDRIETAEPGRIVFDELPAGVRERPTLLAVVEAARAGPRELALGYLTGGLTWRADYVAELDATGGRLDLTGLVTVTNNSGAAFEGATVRLVAGEVNRAPEPRPMQAAMEMRAAVPMAAAPEPEAVSDRYLYTLDRPVDLADRETKQVTLLHAAGVAVARRYRFDELVNAHQGADEIGPVNAAIVLEVLNTTESGLGRPLPAGTLRVYENPGGTDSGGRLFAGEDRIRHTAEGETLELTLGRAFDVTGEARRTAFERISNRAYETAQEIVVRNAKAEAAAVRVVGEMPPGWKMLSESAAHEAETANRIAWTLDVPAGGEATLAYRVRISR